MGLLTIGFALTVGLFNFGVKGAIELNGTRTQVTWSDGDSFKIADGLYKGRGTRLSGYNTLESYGPVHRWGDFTARDLFFQAKGANTYAASQVWKCTSDTSQTDAYGRLLVHCPDLVRYMVGEGHGHLMAVGDDKVDPEALKAQKVAMKLAKGIWEKGIPKGILTSLHSIDEQPGGKKAYNRIADPLTGLSRTEEHSHKYAECQEVCMEDSCMIYVPFKRRYGKNRAPCIDYKPKNTDPWGQKKKKKKGKGDDWQKIRTW